MPVLASHTLTHQWTRELRRRQAGPLMAVDLRLDDDEPVTVGHYAGTPRRLTAAQAAAEIRQLDDPRGHEVFVPRAITAKEVRRVRAVRQGIGWRYLPDAHGQRPCACPRCLGRGDYGAARIRARYDPDPPGPTKPQLMAALRAAETSDQITEALWALGGRRRGGAEELEHLVDHPDPEVRDTLADLLQNYRGRAARELLTRLGRHGR
ncbi:HEAT repeat domain-containing protein [Micromonospora sp. DT47]|uniref:HEAT repeat domain-containing protein n=1 Tax=Micromonospora sp. DT47 TaxID=3393431 RepID=UPI003CE785D9